VYAFLTHRDVLEATRAAGAMLIRPDAPLAALIAAAALVHAVVSFFWASVLRFLLPPCHIAVWAMAWSAGVALLDLRVIAPIFFGSVASLPFWPQFADHLMWGACLGVTLQLRLRRNSGN
jgi:hypothetical protein